MLDLGRLTRRAEAGALLDVADMTVLVIRSTLSSVVAARPLLRDLSANQAPTVGPVTVLVVPDREPYRAKEISAALGIGSIMSIVRDAETARVFSAGEPMGWRFPRSNLVRAARAVVTQLTDAAPDPTTGAPRVSAVADRASTP